MRFNRIFFLLVITFNNSYSNNLENFYKFLEQDAIIKLNISITQDQFDEKYNSIGDFFILGSRKYFFDSSELKISVSNDGIVTKNHLNKQIVYNDLVRGELNLFDILSGNRTYIEFKNHKVNLTRYNFNIPSMGFKGYFLFESKSGNLKLIFLDNELNHSISININKIEILDTFFPQIEEEDFEVIDLRG